MSTTSAKRKVTHLAKHIIARTARELKISPCQFSLQLDESVDRASRHNLLGRVRYVCGGTIEERIIFCVELKGHKTASVQFNVMKDFFVKHNIPWNQLGSVCTDGATVNTGKFTGVIQRIKSLSPNLAPTRCFIHRFVLCIKKLQVEFFLGPNGSSESL